MKTKLVSVVRRLILNIGFVFLIIVTSAVVAVGFYIKAKGETKQRLDIGYGVTTDVTYARLEIGDKLFGIPRNYIWSRGGWKGGRVTGINLQTILPDFEPLTEANRHEFDKSGWHRKVSIYLSEHAMPTSSGTTGHVSMSRRDVYERKTDERIVGDLSGPYDLRQKEFLSRHQALIGEDIFIGTKPDGSFYWVQCNKEGRVPFPSCSTYIEYSSHVYIKYTFSKDRLSDWVKIEDGVLNLIRKFEDNLSQGEHK